MLSSDKVYLLESLLRQVREELRPEHWLYKNVDDSKEVQTITSKDIETDQSNQVVSLSEFETIGSYNWLPESNPNEPVIVVPGSPNVLESLSNKQQLVKQKREHFVDENRFHQPDYPLETLFRAVRLCSPDFDFLNDTDIVTDRNNLRKLIDFANGTIQDPFRIDIQRFGNLVLLIRNEESPKRTCDDYGQDFEDKYSRGSEASEGSHRRIVSYKLGPVRLVVRFEVDCVELKDESKPSPRSSTDVNSLASYLSEIKISKSSLIDTAARFNDSSNLNFIKNGHLYKSAEPIELTTKSFFRGVKDYPERKINQMLVSKTDSLIIGWHQRGYLRDIERLSLKQLYEKCGKKENEMEDSLSKLSKLLSKLIEIVKSQEPGAMLSVIPYNMGKELKVYKAKENKQSLPDDLVEYLKR